MTDAERGARQRCRQLATAVTVLGLMAFLASFLLLLSVLSGGAESGLAVGLVLLVTLTGVAIWFANHALVGCGPQATRMALAPMWINRGDTGIRLIVHFVVNWLAIAVVLGWAATQPDPEVAAAVAAACIGGVALIWLGFNRLHRRANRVRNLLLSSSFAAALLAIAFWLRANAD